jgi:hypothetical protein
VLSPKFYINDREVFPKNNRSIKLIDKLIDGTYYQKSLNSSILLWADDYTYLSGIKNNRNTTTDSGVYSMFDTLKFIIYGMELPFIGEFTINDCTFNDYYKTVEFKVTTRDGMTYIKENENTEVNVLEKVTSFFDVEARKYTYYSFVQIRKNTSSIYREGTDYINEDIYTLIYNDWSVTLDDPDRIITNQNWIQVWVSEINYLPILEVVNPDDGWVKTQDYEYYSQYQRRPQVVHSTSMVGDRYRAWIQNPNNFISFRNFYSYNIIYPYQGFTKLYWTQSANRPNVENYRNNPDWLLIYEGTLKLPTSKIQAENDELSECPYFLAIKKSIYDGKYWDGTSYNTYRCMSPKDVISSILQLACPSFKGTVTSAFLFNDQNDDLDDPNSFYNDIELPKLYSGEDKLGICELSGFIRYTAEQKATVKKTALKKWIEAFKNMGLNIGIDINSQGNFRIEHISFYKRKQKSTDVRTRYGKSRNLPKIYSFNSASVPNREYFESENTWNKDFTKKTVLYGNVPTYDGTNEITNQYSQNYIYTDIDGLNEHITSLSTDGFVMMYCIKNSVNRYIVEITNPGFISELNYQNTRLSLANLVSLYHIYDAFKKKFYLEDKELEAKTLKRLKTEKISLIDEDIKDKYLLSEIGSGQVTSIEYPLINGDRVYNIELLHE